MSPRPVRIRVQAMLDAQIAAQLQLEAQRLGISVSALAAQLIKGGLNRSLQGEKSSQNNNMESKLARLIQLAEQEGLFDIRTDP